MKDAPVIILFLVLVLIAVRQVGNFRLAIWQAMLLGAVLVLACGGIGFKQAVLAIDFDVMLFLFGMFVVGAALEASGYLANLSCRIFRSARSVDLLLLEVLFATGLTSALLMNDTLAIIGTPVVLYLADRHGINSKLLLLALAFGVTIGSVMSPIGNPQNLLIAIHGGIANPFPVFFKYLLVPTIINLGLAFLVLRLFYRGHFHGKVLNHSQEPITDPGLARLCRISLALILLMVLGKIVLFFVRPELDFRLTYIALAAAAPILFFSRKRLEIVRRIDWGTLVFFAAMFVLMDSVWRTGFFQDLMARLKLNILALPTVMALSIGLSQLISNVPMVALCLPLLNHAGAKVSQMVALAAGSTIAGNLLILGAASNVIIIQNAEKKTGKSISFLEFARVGIPLTALNTLVYWLFLK
jgi:Na+/H+ antiporter NhaD/arsenite permease-like protein